VLESWSGKSGYDEAKALETFLKSTEENTNVAKALVVYSNIANYYLRFALTDT
jgi:hypothetical protein